MANINFGGHTPPGPMHSFTPVPSDLDGRKGQPCAEYEVRMRQFDEDLQATRDHVQKALVYLDRAEVRIQAGRDLEEALKDAELSCANYEWDLGYQVKAKALKALRRYDEAWAAFDDAIVRSKGHDYVQYLHKERAAFLNQIGDEAHANGQLEKAVELYTGALSTPVASSPKYWANRANARISLKQWAGALDDAKQSLSIRDTLYGRVLEARLAFLWIKIDDYVRRCSKVCAGRKI